jgi:hypothetical protein
MLSLKQGILKSVKKAEFDDNAGNCQHLDKKRCLSTAENSVVAQSRFLNQLHFAWLCLFNSQYTEAKRVSSRLHLETQGALKKNG